MRKPDKNHPITISPYAGEVVISLNETEVARSRNALALDEADFRTIYYLPRNDVNMALLAKSDRTTYCPYKGDAAHYTVTAKGEQVRHLAWSYEEAYPAVSEISDFVAFYPKRCTVSALKR